MSTKGEDRTFGISQCVSYPTARRRRPKLNPFEIVRLGVEPDFYFIGEILSSHLDRCSDGRVGLFQTGKVQEDFTLAFLEFEQPRPRHSRISFWRHCAARLTQERFNCC